MPSAAERERIKAARELKQAEERQANQYDTAVKHFNARRFDKALPYFQKAADGPQPTLRHRARIHAEICRQQKQSSKVKLRTADEYYNYGVKLMNERRLKEAERHLSEALKLQPKASHIHLATAALGALSGDTKSVYRSLKRAIELDPRNRVLALNDADFSGVLADPSIAELLHASGTTN